MTLLSQFNRAVQEIPTWAEDLKLVIGITDWPKKKKKHSTSLIQQLQQRNLLHSLGDTVRFSQLNLILTPSDCDVNGLFNANNSEIAKHYVEDLLRDIKCPKAAVFPWLYFILLLYPISL